MRPRVPREVRDEVCRYAARRREKGAPWALIARETGLDVRKLQRWHSRARRRSSVAVLRPVEVLRERDGSDLTLAHCWVHVRRKFVEAEPHYPEVGEMIDWIAQLYAIEAETKQSKPVLDEIRTRLMTQRALRRSALGKAIAYTSGLWPGLVRFLADPKIPLDTNSVERVLRGVAVGRKNHYGSRSE